MNVKYELSQETVISDNNGFTILKIENKQYSLIYGLLAYFLLVQGAVNLNFISIGYAFFVCLPMSYLQMKKHEFIQKKIYGGI